MMEFRKHFGYDVEKASNEACIPADEQGESLTVQSMTEDADINVMMKRFKVTGKLPENPRVPTFGDFEGVSDFSSAMQAINDAEEAFMEYPAETRALFENNPQKLMEFVSKEENRPAMIKLGMMREGAAAPVPASAAPPAPPRNLETPVASAPVVP